jgi:Na+/proline symporter
MATIIGNPAPARTPGYKFGLIVLLGAILAIPLFSVYLLVYDRQSQSTTAKDAIVAGWGDTQTLTGPWSCRSRTWCRPRPPTTARPRRIRKAATTRW